MRFLVASLLVAGVLGVGLEGVRRFQVQRNAAVFLQRSVVLEEEGRWRESAELIHRYLRLATADAEARIRLATVFDKSISNDSDVMRAIELYEHAVGLAPERGDLHVRLAELLATSRQMPAALTQTRAILSLDPGNSRALAIMAEAMEAEAAYTASPNYDAVIEAYRRALEADPTNTAAALRLARLLRQKAPRTELADRARLADRVVDELVQSRQHDAEALLARYRYARQYGLSSAEEDLETAMARHGEHGDVLLSYVEHLVQAGQLPKAHGLLSEAVRRSPAELRLSAALAETQIRQEDYAGAAQTLRRLADQSKRVDFAVDGQLAAVLIRLGQLNEGNQLISALEQHVAAAASMLSTHDRIELHRNVRQLRADWHLANGEHFAAVRILRSLGLADSSQNGPGGLTASRLAQRLGASYAALGQWDLAAIEFERATSLEPRNTNHQLQAAQAREAAAQWELAEEWYQQLVRRDQEHTAAWLGLTRVRLQQQLNRPPADRQWARFTDALLSAQRRSGPSLDLAMIGARYALAVNEPETAIATLRAVEPNLDSPTELLAVAMWYAGHQLDADANRLIHRLQASHRGAGLANMVLAEVACQQRDYRAAQKILEQGLEQAAAEDQTMVELALIEVARLAGRPEESLARLAELCETLGHPLGTTHRLADRAAERRNALLLRQVENRLHELEGDEGCLWREARIRRLLLNELQGGGTARSEAWKLQAEIEARRPAWGRAFTLKAQLQQAAGNATKALEAYQRAIELGDRRPEVFQQAILLSFRLQRIADANRYLAIFGASAGGSRDLAAAAVPAYLAMGELQQAEAIAAEFVDSHPDDAMAKLWLSQTLVAAGQHDRAAELLQQAVRQAPESATTWLALVAFQAVHRDEAAVVATLNELDQRAPLASGDEHFVRAQAYELLGNHRQARQHYLEARRLADGNPIVLEQCARYFVATQASEAEQTLRLLLKASPASAAARRALASVLAARGGEEAWQEAWLLMESAGPDETLALADRRLKALLLVYRGTPENRQQARATLEELVQSEQGDTDADRLLLARLYEEDGQAMAAQRLLQPLADRRPANPAHLAAYVGLLLRNENADEAAAYLGRLETELPDLLTTYLLRARWYALTKRNDEAEPHLERFLGRWLQSERQPEERTLVMLQIAQFYSEIGLTEAAERSYQRVHEIDPTQYPVLASFLAAQGRLGEAIELCNAVFAEDPAPRAVRVLCSLLARHNAAPELAAMADKTIVAASQLFHDDDESLFAIATLRYMQQRQAESISLFRQVLELAPNHHRAMNNLAQLLAESQAKGNEALRLIHRAIALQGPKPELLDTLGVVLLHNNQPREAAEVLQRVLRYPRPDPRYRLHLAMAWDALGDEAQTRATLQTALQADLHEMPLTSFERAQLARLSRNLLPEDSERFGLLP